MKYPCKAGEKECSTLLLIISLIFYPRVSVYDDYNGWDKLDFTDGQEFYNDFNDYAFTVTVPKNYIVWATGDLQNAEEVLQPVFADKLKSSLQSDSIFHIATKEDMLQKQVTAQQAINTWNGKPIIFLILPLH